MAGIGVAFMQAQDRDPEVLRIAGLSGKEQTKALRSALLSRSRGKAFGDTLFYSQEQLRGSLRRLVSDRKAGTEAAYYLCLIADHNDLRAIIRRPPRARTLTDFWAYQVASSVMEAGEEEEWNFLWDCLMGKKDPWASSGAIQTLKLIGSPRSLAMLEQAHEANLRWGGEVDRAIAFAKIERPPFHGSSLGEVAGRVAHLVGAENGEMPRYDAGGDKALVDVRLTAGRDLLIYTASFSRVDGEWYLRGFREVMQGYLGPAPI